jgi:peptidoglycan hydrolase-like protein with peptidoglycan-binding domain
MMLDWLGAVVLTTLLLAVPESLLAKTHHRRSSAHTPKSAAAKHVASKSTHHGRKSRHSRNWKHHGQQNLDAQRTGQIQDALIRSHYLDGEASGTWDAKTQEALRRYQAANGWQSKVVPDSRALIKLGLGPSNARLLNPESAMTSRVEATPSAPHSDPNSPR